MPPCRSCSQPLVNTDDRATTAQRSHHGPHDHPRHPDLDAILANARTEITIALDAARAKLAEHEQAVAPLKAETSKMEQTLARLDGTTAPAARRTLRDEERADRAAKRRARREARKVQEPSPAS